ncbi:MAG: hypothetical protein AAB320_07770 [Elusimicrobiota bacterium]
MAGKTPLAVKFLSALLSGALIAVSPGLPAWAAAAQIAPISINTPIGGANGSAGAVRGQGQSNLSGNGVTAGVSLTGALAPSIGAPRLSDAPVFALPAAQLTPSVLPGESQTAAPAATLDEHDAPRSAGASLTAPKGAAVEPVAARNETQAFESALPPASRFQQGVGRVKTGFTALKSLFEPRRDAKLSVQDSAEGGQIQGSENALKSPQAKLGASPANAPNGDSLKTSDDKGQPPVPPGESDKKAPGKKWLGLGAVVIGLIGGMLVMQLGLEAQGAAMAQLTEKAFGDFSILAQVAIFASLGSMIGQQLAQFFSAKFGLTKTFYAAHALRALSLGGMVFLLGTGMMPLPLMFAFYAFNGVVTGIGANAEGTLRKFILAQQGVSQQKFRTWWQLLAEIVAVPAPMILGALVPMLGASLITGLYPATILIGLMVFFMFKIIPFSAAQRIEAQLAKNAPAQQAQAAEPGAPKASAWQRVKAAFKQIFGNMEEGKDFVMNTPALKYSLLGAVIFDLMNLIIYRLIAPGYGKLVAGAADMAAVQGNIVGMFSLGGLLLAAAFLVMEKRSAKADKAKSETERTAQERSSMLRWMMLGVPALGLLGVMAFKLALPFAPVIFMGVNWVPATALAAALIPFGFFQVAASIKLNSYFNEKLPEDPAKVQKAIAFSGSAMTALSILLMLALKPLFGDLAAFDPFPWLAAALVPVGAAVFYLQRKLSAATKPENMAATEAPASKAGGYVGLILGVLSAALILTALPFIPGAGAMIAGLGVLGKFVLHLSVALALPIAGYFADRALRRR